MTGSETKPESDSSRLRSPIQWGAILLGIYIAMHLAVGGIIRLVDGQEATAAAMQTSALAADAERESDRKPGVDRSSKADALDRVSLTVEGPRECKLSLLIDSDCIFE
jgi:hypothetical protein